MHNHHLDVIPGADHVQACAFAAVFVVIVEVERWRTVFLPRVKTAGPGTTAHHLQYADDGAVIAGATAPAPIRWGLSAERRWPLVDDKTGRSVCPPRRRPTPLAPSA